MAKSNKEIIVRVGANTAEFNKAMKGLNTNMASMQKSMANMGKMLAGAFSVGAITAFAGAAIRASEEQSKANQKLLVALGGREDVQKRLLKQAEDIRSKTGIDDAAINEIQTFAAAQGRSESQIKKNTAAAVQLAAVTGIDLLSAMKQVDATMEGNVGRLGKLDARFKDLTVTQLQNGDAVDLILEKYNGLAESQATQLTLLTSNWGEFQEQAGNALGVVLNPLLEQTNKLLKQLNSADLTWMDKLNSLRGLDAESEFKLAVIAKKAKDIEDIQNSPAFKKSVAQGIADMRVRTGYKPPVTKTTTTKTGKAVKEAEGEISTDQKMTADRAASDLVIRKEFAKKSIEINKEYNDRINELGQRARDINIEGFKETGEALQLYLESYYNAQQEYHQLTTDQFTLEAERYKEMLDKKLISEKQYMELVSQLRKDKIAQDLAATAEGLAGIATLFKEESVAYKLLASAQALISTWLAGANILANTAKLGPIAMGIAFAGTIATGLSAVAKINGVKLAEGGIVPGGYPNDSYPAMLTSGETVVPAKKLPDFQSQQVEVYGVIKAGDIYISNKRGEYLTKRRG